VSRPMPHPFPRPSIRFRSANRIMNASFWESPMSRTFCGLVLVGDLAEAGIGPPRKPAGPPPAGTEERGPGRHGSQGLKSVAGGQSPLSDCSVFPAAGRPRRPRTGVETTQPELAEGVRQPVAALRGHEKGILGRRRTARHPHRKPPQSQATAGNVSRSASHWPSHKRTI